MILTRDPRARRDRDGRHAAGVGDPGIGHPVLSDSGAATVASSGAGGPMAAADRPLGYRRGAGDSTAAMGPPAPRALAGSTRVRPRPRAKGGGVCVTHWS
jgi:hypothetical protein